MTDNMNRQELTGPRIEVDNMDREELPPMVPTSEAPYAEPNGSPGALATGPRIEVGGHEAEYRELVKLNSFVVKTVLDMLLVNPMIKPMLGPDFESEASTVSERIAQLLNTIHPNPDAGIDGS